MFEVIISSVATGRVQRKVLETREQADRHIERFLHGGRRPRSPRNYRIEVYYRPLPVVRTMPARTQPELNPAA